MIDKDRFAALWRAGFTVPQISQMMGEKKDSLYKFAHRSKFPKRRSGKPGILTDPEKEKWFKDNYPEMSTRTISVYFGKTVSYINKLARKRRLQKSDTYFASIKEFKEKQKLKFSQSKQK